VRLPTGRCRRWIAQPYFATDDVELFRADEKDGAAIVGHDARSGFVEVTIGVYGHKDALTAMAPTLILRSGEQYVQTYEEKYGLGGGGTLTPPPPALVPPDILDVRRLLHYATVSSYVSLQVCMRPAQSVHRQCV
jgi:hypothetical protein